MAAACFAVLAAGGARAQSPVADAAPARGPIEGWLHDVGLAPQQVGAVALPLDGAQALVAYDAELPLNPASTIKLVTTYAGLSLLGPDYRWRTEARLRGVLREGVLHGDLVLRGGGDPKLVIGTSPSSSRACAQPASTRSMAIWCSTTRSSTAAAQLGDFDGEPRSRTTCARSAR